MDKIVGIQILRGLAAMLVVFAHVQPQLDHFGGPQLTWLGVGGCGVDIFFVISGFIIWVTSQSADMTPAKFLIRRAIRIAPLYWLMTAFVASVALVMPSVMSSTRFQLDHVIASFVFIPYLHPVLDEIYPILVPGWSLNYEAFFYLLFGVALLARKRVVAGGLVLSALLALVAYGSVFAPTQTQLAYFTQPIMLEFGLGLCVGVLYTHGRTPSHVIGVGATG